MNVPMNADVQCADSREGEHCGHTTRVVINPATQQVTHVVVAERRGGPEHLVPIERVMEAQPATVRIEYTGAELAGLERFTETQYLTGESNIATYAPEAYVLWPYMTPAAGIIPVEHERVPPGELAVSRGTRVEANDGSAGRVDAFLIDPTDGRISHLIMREGHLWGRRDVSIPVAQIDHVEEDKVILRLSKDEIAKLPDIPLNSGRRQDAPRPGDRWTGA